MFAFVSLPLAIVLAAGIRVVTKMTGIHDEIYEHQIYKQTDSSKAIELRAQQTSARSSITALSVF